MGEVQYWWQAVPWQIGSLVLAAISITVSIFIALRNRKRKTLDYMIVDDVRVLSERTAGMRSDILVTVSGEKVIDPRIGTVRYINTGNKEIYGKELEPRGISTTDASGTKNSKLAGQSDDIVQATEQGVVPTSLTSQTS